MAFCIACSSWAVQQVAVDDALGDEQEEETVMFASAASPAMAEGSADLGAMRKQRRGKKDGLSATLRSMAKKSSY
jgi:hypothetical protein